MGLEILKPKNLLDSLFSSNVGTTPAPVQVQGSKSSGGVSGIFQSIGETAGQTAAAAIKPLFPMLLIGGVVIVGTIIIFNGGFKLKWNR